MDYFIKSIWSCSEGYNTFSIFTSINLFLGIQYNLYKSEIDHDVLLDIIESLINKIIYKKFNGHEYRAITTNELFNLYGYARESSVILKNENLVKRLINELKEYSISEKIEVSQNLLLNIYKISNNPIKKLLNSFLMDIDINQEKELYKKVIFGLLLAIYDIKPVSSKLLKNVEDYLNQLKNRNVFSSILYMIKSQIEHLIKHNDLQQMDALLKEINAIIERYEKSRSLSIL